MEEKDLMLQRMRREIISLEKKIEELEKSVYSEKEYNKKLYQSLARIESFSKVMTELAEDRERDDTII